MPKIKIAAKGVSKKAEAQSRGKLFEEIIAEVMKHHGYKIDDIKRPSVNYAGMEGLIIKLGSNDPM